MRISGGLAVMGLIVATPAVARDHTGYQAISTGNLAAAERMLAAERRIFPDRPELLLNLAAVYGRTGRPLQANAMYQATLAQPDVAMELADGTTASSHALAQSGRAQLAALTVAAR